MGQKKPRMKKKIIIIAVVIILVLLVAIRIGMSAQQAALQQQAEMNRVTYTPVEAQTVEKKSISSTITLSGKIQADKEAPVMVKTPGKVTAIYAKVGDVVKKDQVLLSLDKSDIMASYNQARAGYELAEAAYKTNMDNYQKSVENLERAKQLYEAGAISKLELEQAEMAASENVRQTFESQFAQAKVALDMAQKALDDMDIKSPINGIVTAVDTSEGTFAVNTMPVVKVVDLSQVYVTVNVSENEINNLKAGQEVEVNVPAASMELKGRIDSLSLAANMQGQYTLKVNLNNKDGVLKPGMFANVSLSTATRDNVLTVPTDAVVYHGGRYVVYVAEGSTAVEKVVETGLDNGQETEIISGLQEDEIIIIKGQDFVKDGSEIKVVTLDQTGGGAE